VNPRHRRNAACPYYGTLRELRWLSGGCPAAPSSEGEAREVYLNRAGSRGVISLILAAGRPAA
jgi:hypothetical protein